MGRARRIPDVPAPSSRGPSRREMWQPRLIGALALLLLGVAGLAVSFVLSPTPDTFMVMSNGHRVRTPATMHAVDYAIFILRIGGAVAALAGAYLAYRVWRPDSIDHRDGLQEHPRDAFADIPPHAGVHVTHGGFGQGGGSSS